MGLRTFHLVFIALSAVLAAFFAAWAAEQYQIDHRLTYAIASVFAVASAAALVTYAVAFQRKTRGL
jgi:hypothetical protein